MNAEEVTWCRSATCLATRLGLPKRKSMTVGGRSGHEKWALTCRIRAGIHSNHDPIQSHDRLQSSTT